MWPHCFEHLGTHSSHTLEELGHWVFKFVGDVLFSDCLYDLCLGSVSIGIFDGIELSTVAAVCGVVAVVEDGLLFASVCLDHVTAFFDGAATGAFNEVQDVLSIRCNSPRCSRSHHCPRGASMVRPCRCRTSWRMDTVAQHSWSWARSFCPRLTADTSLVSVVVVFLLILAFVAGQSLVDVKILQIWISLHCGDILVSLVWAHSMSASMLPWGMSHLLGRSRLVLPSNRALIVILLSFVSHLGLLVVELLRI